LELPITLVFIWKMLLISRLQASLKPKILTFSGR
jgi:hypothetical protein